MFRSLSVVLLAGLGLFSAASHAALISVDDAVLGSDKLTLDTATGLQWIDMDLTWNLSWNEANSTYSAQGFRHATLDEVETFFTHAGISGIDSGTSAANYTPSVDLQSLITCFAAYSAQTGQDTCSNYGWTALVGSKTELSWIHRDNAGQVSTVIVNSNNITSSLDFAHPTRGHWMVRTIVPVPPALLLFPSALAALGWFRRKREA